ncbi:type II secretion system protein [uncultured Peptostreptococcus sp.]|uniref:type II secretion system protein n=2 Tax=Peptostreptococcus stomatis TaxID=341694 RepID=UPI002804D236|nr:type II secretion system protein [uncultured Peptostreptococcus sp.]
MVDIWIWVHRIILEVILMDNLRVENTSLRKAKKRRGFTLVELVIVVAIIGILAGVVAIKFSGAQKKARENADYANASNIATAVYMAESEGKEGDDIKNIDKLVEAKYLSSKPKPQSVTGDFAVEEDAVSKELKVTAGGKTFYPKPD